MLRVQLSAKWIVVFLFQKVRKKKVSVVQAKKLLLCLQQRITIKKTVPLAVEMRSAYFQGWVSTLCSHDWVSVWLSLLTKK